MFNEAAEHGTEIVRDKLLFEEAKELYMHGDGSPVYVQASSVDLSKVDPSDFNYIGQKKSIQLFFHGDEYTNQNDALVYGGITIVYAGGDQVGIYPDTYNFEMHDWSSNGEVVRNLATLGARIVHHDFGSSFPSSHPFDIYFVGTATIGGKK